MNAQVKRLAKVVLINYVIFLTLLVTLELVGQLGYKLVTGRFLFENSRTIFREHPYLVAIPSENSQVGNDDESIKITINNQGHRVSGAHNDHAGKSKIVCLGGSTTFGTGVTDEDTWPHQLQEKLGENYTVYNLGVPGYSTLENIIQLTTTVQQLSPDIIIIYAGWNDIRNYHIQPCTSEYYWHGLSQRTNLNVAHKEFSQSFFLMHFAKKMGNIFFQRSPSTVSPLSNNDPCIDSIYLRNLRTLQILSSALHAQAIFVPQIMNVKAFQESNERSEHWTPTILNSAMPGLMTRFNLLMEDSIQSNAYTTVVKGLGRESQWSEKYFIDKAHFSKLGGERFAEEMRKVIEAL